LLESYTRPTSTSSQVNTSISYTTTNKAITLTGNRTSDFSIGSKAILLDRANQDHKMNLTVTNVTYLSGNNLTIITLETNKIFNPTNKLSSSI
jgi:hypothetical protein